MATHSLPTITAEIVFLSTANGGRRSLPPEPCGQYRPHAVVDGTDEYLGVQFAEGPQPEFEVPGVYRLGLLYHPLVDYSALTEGALFTLREGSRVVATGRVLTRSSA